MSYDTTSIQPPQATKFSETSTENGDSGTRIDKDSMDVVEQDVIAKKVSTKLEETLIASDVITEMDSLDTDFSNKSSPTPQEHMDNNDRGFGLQLFLPQSVTSKRLSLRPSNEQVEKKKISSTSAWLQSEANEEWEDF